MLPSCKFCPCAREVIFVAAAKTDQPVRKVFEKEGREWAQSKGFPFYEVCR